MIPPEALRDWLAFTGVASGAALGVAAIIGGAYRLAVQPRLCRLERTLGAVEYHLLPNGSEDAEAHPDDRGLPVRTLVTRTAREVRAIRGDLADSSAWMRDHEVEHIRHDPEWPARGMGVT